MNVAKINLGKSKRQAAILLSAATFMVGGLFWLQATRASNLSVTNEAEHGTVGGLASLLADSSASNGQAVKFGLANGSKVTFQDDFNGSTLNAAWQFSPGASSSYQLNGDTFNLTAAPANDQWVNVDTAPRLLKAQPAGNWTVETHLTSKAAGTVFGGLTIFGDAANWLLWGQLGNGSLEANGLINNTPTEPFGVMATQYEYLRIRKAGSTYYFDASANGTHWNNANVYYDTANVLANARVGLMVKNWAAAGGAPFTMMADHYKEYDQDIMPSALAGTATVSKVAQQTGYDSLNDTRPVGICGTDLGEMFSWQNKVFLAFGDTIHCDGRPESPAATNNVLAYTTDNTPADGLKFDGWATDSAGKASLLFDQDPGMVTSIPTGGVGIGDKAYLYYMNIADWTDWRCPSSSVATANATNIAAWTKQPSVSWSTGNFNMVTVWQQDDNTLYVWGTPCGRFGSIKLMKVAPSGILNKSAYRYFSGIGSDGQPRWSANEADGTTVAGGPAGELSVIYNPWLGRYIMTYLDERKAAIVMRESPTPWGNWSAPIQLARGAEYPQLYGAYMHPKYVENNGQTVYFHMSQFGPYNTFLMKAVLAKR